jgi:hypothetical protein
MPGNCGQSNAEYSDARSSVVRDIQPRDQLEMADVPGPDRIPEFQRADAIQQIRDSPPARLRPSV